MSQASVMEGVLAKRLALFERLRRAEYDIARDEHARAAAALLRGRTHDLGNALQIVRLASLEIARRADGAIAELVADLRRSAEEATAVLGELLAAARPAARTGPGAPVARIVRDALELARGALLGPLEMRIDVPADARTACTADELEAMTLAAVLEAGDAARIAVSVRARTIAGEPWIELLRADDRALDEVERPVAPPGGLFLIERLAARVGGEVSLSPGRGGPELAIALPVVSA